MTARTRRILIALGAIVFLAWALFLWLY